MTTETLVSRPEITLGFEDGEAPARKYLWTMESVSRAMAAGIFGGEPCDRLNMELIEGELIEKMTPNPPHWTAVLLIQDALRAAFGPGYAVSAQSLLYVDEHSVPEPDVMVLEGAIRDYKTQPTGANARLVVEVSDMTARKDRTTKVALYARAGVTEYWALVLKDRTLEVRRDPIQLIAGGFRYRTRLTFQENETVTPLHAPGAIVKIADLLPDAA